jgi:putative nucleotidyltransferase with HDIG domain
MATASRIIRKNNLIALVEHLAKSFETMRLSLAELHTERESMFLSTIHALVAALESKDDYTCSHSMEVAELAATITAELGLAEQEQFKIKFAALLHDIGKIGIPDSVLHKQGELTDEEWQTMKQHPEIGAKIISTIPNMEDIVEALPLDFALAEIRQCAGKQFDSRIVEIFLKQFT